MNNQRKFSYFRFALTFRAFGESSIFIRIQKKVVSPSLGFDTIYFNHPYTLNQRLNHGFLVMTGSLTLCCITVKNILRTTALSYYETE